MPEAVVFKTEASLWEMMARGEKTWDARRWDLADERIYRLAWGRSEVSGPVSSRLGTPGPVRRSGGLLRKDARRDGSWEPVEKEVVYLNKATGHLLTCAYRGMEFAPWAPGWCFLLLGGLSFRAHPEVTGAS